MTENKFSKMLESASAKGDGATTTVRSVKSAIKPTILSPSQQKAKRTIYISEAANEKITYLTTATGRSIGDIMESAIHQYFEAVALENDKVRALKTLFEGYKPPRNEQQSLDM